MVFIEPAQLFLYPQASRARLLLAGRVVVGRVAPESHCASENNKDVVVVANEGLKATAFILQLPEKKGCSSAYFNI
jgi:hypothetical protein